MKIKNINENFGDSIEFDSVEEMEATVEACGYELPADGLLEGRDFENVGIKSEECESK